MECYIIQLLIVTALFTNMLDDSSMELLEHSSANWHKVVEDLQYTTL